MATSVPFSPVPNPDAGRADGADLVLLVFLHSRLSLGRWQELINRNGDDSLRSSISHAAGTTDVTFSHAQPLDRQQDDAGDVTADGNSGGARVLEILVHTSHRPLHLSDCRQIRQHASLTRWEQAHSANLILQPAALYTSHRTNPGLVVFDMDSTLIQQEVIDELARHVGRYAEVSAITEAAMRGDPAYADFAASLRARVALLRGVPADVWPALRASTISFTPGARALTRALRAAGWHLAVLSGGFMPLASWVREELGLHYAFANELVEAQGQLTGELVPGAAIVDGARKEALLRELAARHDVPLARTLAVGDGSNDLPMMLAAGLGVAFNAKPRVQAAAPARLNGESLADVLYVLGYTKAEAMALLEGAEL